MMIAKNKYTAQFNRENRFLIDDDDAEIKLAYTLTKPMKIGWTYDNEGVYKFVLTESNSEDTDNHKLGIANYYKYFPKDAGVSDVKISGVTITSSIDEDSSGSVISDSEDSNDGRRVWI